MNTPVEFRILRTRPWYFLREERSVTSPPNAEWVVCDIAGMANAYKAFQHGAWLRISANDAESWLRSQHMDLLDVLYPSAAELFADLATLEGNIVDSRLADHEEWLRIVSPPSLRPRTQRPGGRPPVRDDPEAKRLYNEGERLRSEIRGITRDQIAARLGLSLSAYKRYVSVFRNQPGS